MPTFIAQRTNWLVPLIVLFVISSLPVLGQTITGTVYRDFNSDGKYTSIPSSGTYVYGEPGVSGVIVKAYNASGVASASATTNAGGSYTLTVGSSSQFRIEFTSLLTGDYESFRGTGSATSVQFVNGGTSNVNLGVNYPVDYCQLDPLVIVPCYVNGNSTGTGSGTAVAANRDVLISLPYSSTGDSPTENPIALNSQLGTVYGVAYQREAKYIFTSAFLKRHSGLGPGGAGAIYLTKSSGTTYTHSVFATLPTAITAVTAAGSTTVASNTTRGLSTSAASANYDPLIFDQVGKAGLGDMELSDDGTELFVVNLGDRKLYRIPIVNPTSATPTPGTITSYTIPTPTQTSGSQFRPFGLKYYRDRVYVGGVTTNEAVSTTVSFGVGSTSNTPLITRDTTGMKAVVYEFNPANGSFTTVLTFPLTYKKGASDNDQTGSSRADRWFPWVSVQPSYPNPTAGQLPNRYARNDLANASHPQPWLTDIEIDVDGSMIIALRDRFGEQYGNQNYGTDAPSTQLYRAIAPGDILRAGKCSPNVNQWTIESNAKLCNGVATLGAGTNQGIGGGEYYYADAISSGNANGPYHVEMALGGLALLPGYGEVLSTAMDPTDNTDANGLRKFKSDGSGSPATSTQIFYSGNNVATYGKGNGLGDVGLACNLAPIQIGNRVWVDSNNNGIQDPGEGPLAGVKVTLAGPGLTSPVSVTTNASGEYYFSSSTSGTAATGYAYSLTGLTSGSSYSLTFPTSASAGTLLLSNKPNSATGTNTDVIDTDPNAAGLISFTLGQAGENNFSYDAGYAPCIPPSLTAIASSNTVCLGTPITLTAQISPADSYTYTWSAPASVTLTGATTATATAIGLPTGTTTFTVTASSSPICSTLTTVSVTVNPLPTASLTSATICVGQSVTLTATGGSSYTFSNGTVNNTGLLIVSPVSTTAYSVTVANASGCKSTTTASVTVNPLPTANLTSATICAGQSTTITATGGTSYSFSNGTVNTTGLVVVSPVSTTAYSVTVANASGCRSTTTGTVTVMPQAVLSLQASATLVTVGTPLSLSAIGCVGTVNWSTGATGATLSVTPANPTNTYSATCTTGPGCFTTASITVNTAPPASLVVLSATVCYGNSATLVASGCTGTVTWSNSTTGLTLITPALTNSTSYTATCTTGTGSTTTAVGNVTVMPQAVLSLQASATLVTVGSPLSLSAIGCVGTVNWSTGATGATLSVTPASPTNTYSATCTTGPGCFTTASITVNTAPPASLVVLSATVCYGNSATLVASGCTGTVTWSNSTTGLTLITPALTNSTSYTATCTTGTGSTTTAVGTVTVMPQAVLSLQASATLVTVGTPLSLSAIGCVGTVNWSTGATGATLSVTPANPTNTYSATCTTGPGCFTTASITVNTAPPASLVVLSATVCYGNSATLVASGCTGTVTWSNSTTGLTLITPALTNSTSYTATCTTGTGSTTTAVGNVTVMPQAVLSLQASATLVTVGSPLSLSAIGCVGTVNWSTGATGATLSVTPANPTNTYSATCTTGPGCFTTASITVNTTPNCSISLTTSSLPSGIVGQLYSATLAAAGGIEPYSFSIAAGTLPTGLILSTNTGVISGIPTTNGSFSTTVVITDSQSCSLSVPLSVLKIDLAPLCNMSAVVTPGLCNTATNTFTLSGTIALTNNATGGIIVLADGLQSTSVSVSNAETAIPFSVTGLLSDGSPHLLLATLSGCGTTSTTYTAPQSCSITPLPTLSLEKLVDKSKAKIGDVLTYTIVVTNSGTTAGTNVVVRDSSTTGLTYLANSATAPVGTTFIQGLPFSTWTIGSINAGQSLSLTFQARVDSSGILYNKATIPGDTATVCTSVPFIMCAGDSYEFTLTAPTGRSSYKWYKDNVEISGQTTNVLTVTGPGTYSLAVDNVSGKCPDFSCCPFIIEEDSLPTFQALALPATCVGNQAQANGKIVLSSYNPAYTYQYSLGSSFNEAAVLSGAAQVIPAGGVLVSNLASPATTQAYTIRVYNASGCYTDVTVLLLPTVCGCPPEVCVPYVISQSKRAKRIGDPR